MGVLVQGPVDASKKALSVATVSGGAISVDPGNAAIFIGGNLLTKRTTAFSRLRQCSDVGREQGFPTGENFQRRSVIWTGAKRTVVTADGATNPILTEDDVAVIWTGTFTAATYTHRFKSALHHQCERLREALTKS